jgi:hypothetical protein
MEPGNDCMNQLPNKFKIYESAESVFSDEAHSAVYYPLQFLGGQETSEMPTKRFKKQLYRSGNQTRKIMQYNKFACKRNV